MTEVEVLQLVSPAHRLAGRPSDGPSPGTGPRLMDVTIGPGAQRALRGRGGVRCTLLSDGVLTLGPATFRVVAGADAVS
ncbi:hypothetical protein [Streptomyces violaceus]|uniref:Uncharacterized protein n=1 Tax=Streptomyces violaceus TaxID=1936 RepID=A0ABY9U196_STRVL|nr:hypothetical protein [Streptomyces janthinus]WND16017.1 hypothetical protein RI060_01000 [Streptomyces janthinus]GGS94983.1 hypothetical protein GCM10010270_78830 [Streptomyces janthinus]